MKQHWIERLNMWICKQIGHKKTKGKETWEHNGSIRSVCKRCGVVYSIKKKL